MGRIIPSVGRGRKESGDCADATLDVGVVWPGGGQSSGPDGIAAGEYCQSGRGQVVQLSQTMDALVVECGEGVHIDGQEVGRQGCQKVAARFRIVRHP